MRTEVFDLPSCFPVKKLAVIANQLKEALQQEGLNDVLRVQLLLLDAGLATYRTGRFMVPEPHNRILEDWVVFAERISEQYLMLGEIEGAWLKAVTTSSGSQEELFLDQTIFLFVPAKAAC